MKIPWNIIIAMAIVATLAFTGYDVYLASSGDSTLAQYNVTKIQPDLGTYVFQHLSDTRGNIIVNSDEIGDPISEEVVETPQ